jgi:hypothetical protein
MDHSYETFGTAINDDKKLSDIRTGTASCCYVYVPKDEQIITKLVKFGHQFIAMYIVIPTMMLQHADSL